MKRPKKGSRKRRYLISSSWTLWKFLYLGKWRHAAWMIPTAINLSEQPNITIPFRRSDALTSVLMKKSSGIGHLLLQGSVKKDPDMYTQARTCALWYSKIPSLVVVVIVVVVVIIIIIIIIIVIIIKLTWGSAI